MEPSVKTLPYVSCLCPTFHRPQLLANALACFFAQDYPADRMELVILDDGNDFAESPISFNAPAWSLFSDRNRYPSLPAKFNEMVRRYSSPEATVFLVWEDDDVYLPHHVSSHVAALQEMQNAPDPFDWRRLVAYSKPSRVLSTYTGTPETEGAAGRFHASIAFTLQLFLKTGGWPVTKRADFDQQWLARLAQGAGDARTVDPCTIAPPSYCFRYGTTQAYHGQHFMRGGEDETWYDRVPHNPGNRNLMLRAQFDAETLAVYRSHGLPAAVR